MNRKVPKTKEIPQLQHTGDVVDVPFVLVVHVPHEQVVAETAEIPQLLSDAQVPRVRVVAKTVEIPKSLFAEKTVAIPEIQTVQGPQTSESLSTEGTVAEKTDHGIVMQSVVPNTGLDSFIDDLSSVGRQGLNRQDCEVLSHVGKQSGSIQQQQHQDCNQQQPTRQVTQEIRRERGKERKGEGGKEEEGREAEEAEHEQVKKDVTDWTGVTRSKKHRKRTVKIFVKVDGSKVTPMEESEGRQSPGRDEADPERRGRVCDNTKKSAEKKRKAGALRSN